MFGGSKAMVSELSKAWKIYFMMFGVSGLIFTLPLLVLKLTTNNSNLTWAKVTLPLWSPLAAIGTTVFVYLVIACIWFLFNKIRRTK